MRQPLYVNHTTLDKNACRNYLAMTWPRQAGAIRWVLIGLAVFTLAYGSWRLYVGKMAALLYAATLFFIAAVALFLALWGWVLRVGRYTAAQQKAWGGPTAERVVWFYDDYFEQGNGNVTQRFEYGRIHEVKKTRGMLLLTVGSANLLLRRDGFETGDGKDFLNFLARKCGEMQTNQGVVKLYNGDVDTPGETRQT